MTLNNSSQKNDIQVIKIGGNVINDKPLLHSFLKDFAAIKGGKLLVHGGGKLATEIGKKLGIKPHMIDGRRITDKQTIDLVTMVYAGLINKNIVVQLQQFSCNSIGLSGADNNILLARKRTIKKIDYGFVGDLDIHRQHISNLEVFLQQNITPVICAITHDMQGNLLNTNADTIASVLAILLAKKQKVQLTFCFNKPGVLINENDKLKTLKELTFKQFQNFKKLNYITDGMIPKLDNAFNSLKLGVNSIVIKQAKDLLNSSSGTRIIQN